MLKSFDVTEKPNGDIVTKVAFWSKEKGIELLGKHLSMFIEKHEHTGSLTLEDIVAGSRRKDGER